MIKKWREKGEIIINFGFANPSLFDDYINKTFMFLVDYDNGIMKRNVGEKGQKENELKREKKN